MHITSLPSKYGIGTLGVEAYRFVDFLRASGQRYWQMLPLGHTGWSNSPYQAYSSYAGNPYLIDLDFLCDEGLLDREGLSKADELYTDDTSVSFDLIKADRLHILRESFAKFMRLKDTESFDLFCNANKHWLEDYALFMVLRECNEGRDAVNVPRSLHKMNRSNTAQVHAEAFWKYVQFKFYEQWCALKSYANNAGVYIIGDLPIYVSADSVDVWAHPEVFALDEVGLPMYVAGCPPDYFSDRGQLWGNPVYDWEYLESTRFRWWMDRIRYNAALFDVIRIDHFRGFDSYYAVPYGERDAVNGAWFEGPGVAFFEEMSRALDEINVIAEDLGNVTDGVRALLSATGFPGMKVLQFAFDSTSENEHLPHNYSKNSVVYTGTHDNNTIVGWAENASTSVLDFARRYVGISQTDSLSWAMIRLAYASVSDLAVIPMQDFLAISAKGRMNTPSTVGDNWRWRMRAGDLTDRLSREIYELTALYGRN